MKPKAFPSKPNMTKFIDITVVGFNAQYTRRAHGFSVDTQILLKLPRENMMTIRLKSESPENICAFLAAEGWEEFKIELQLSRGLHQVSVKLAQSD